MTMAVGCFSAQILLEYFGLFRHSNQKWGWLQQIYNYNNCIYYYAVQNTSLPD